MRASPLLALAAIATSTLSLGAQAPSPRQHFSLEMLRRLVGLGGVTLSPDGKTVVVTVTRPNYERNKNESELWAVDVASGQARQLTLERRAVSGARFSPDGKTLAFLAPDTAGRAQLWLMPMTGGEPRRLTAHPSGVEHYAWRPDGAAIAYAAGDEPERREGEAKYLTTFVVGEQDIFLRENLRSQHIWLARTDGAGTAPVTGRRLTSGAWTIEFALPPGSPPSGLSWSADGGTIAFAQVVAPQSGKLDSTHVALLDVATGAVRPLTSAHRFENNPAFSPDGRSVAYLYPREGRGDRGWEVEAHVAPAAGGSVGRSVTRVLDRNLFGVQWMPDGKSLLVAANDRTGVGAWVVPVDGGAPRRVDTGDLVVSGAYGYDITVAAQAPTIAFTATTAERPAELYVVDRPGARPRRLTSFNAWADSVAWGRSERVTWRSDSLAPDGVVTLPADFDPARRYPLVLYIHGGPTSASKLSFSLIAQLMAAEGLVVFQPNYRGSDNLGNDFQSAIVGDAGAGPGRDVMAGVAMLRTRPYVDPQRTAVTGWSYGGFMTSWLIATYPDEWRAAMAGAPVTSWEDQYDYGDANVTIRYLFGGNSPWTGTHAAEYRAQSPITYASRIRTPTLVMSNIEDFRVPPTQAFSLYRAMKDNGVETQFIAFTGRTHASSDPVNARERARLWVGWVKDHLAAPKP